MTDEAAAELGSALRIMLEQGFGDEESTLRVGLTNGVITVETGEPRRVLADLSFPAVSLRFAVRSAGRPKPVWRDSANGKRVLAGGDKALRDYRAAGAYVLKVRGATVELMTFLVAHLLTQPDMVAVRRCQRPGCSHFIIAATAARGRPQTFCSASCRVRSAEQKPRRPRRKKTVSA